jgi:hypothetical protein
MSAPIPLPNQGGGDNTMLIAGLVACCCSSSIGGGIFAFLRMRGARAKAAATKRVSRPRPRPSNIRSDGGAAIAARARARAARRAARARARAARRAARARRRAARARARAARARARAARDRKMRAKMRLAQARARKQLLRAKMKRRFRRRGGKVGRRFKRRRFRCFAPETAIQLKNGTTRQMKNLELGDVLINGSIVEATMNIRNHNDPYYKIGDIHVTGSHYVKDGNVYKQVRNFSKAEPTDKVAKVVCCLVTNDHKIPVGDFVFWDWEDNLVPNHIQQPSKITTLRNRTRNTSVVGDK